MKKHKYSLTEYIRRYVMLVIGLFILAFGVAVSTRANLGTSPISCVPFILSLKMPYTMGEITIAMHVVFIALQIVLLRKDYELIQLLQLAIAFVFGCFTDFTLWMASGIHADSYLMQWILCLISCVIAAIGVYIEVKADVVMLAGEGLMTAISRVFHIEFGKVKVGFDSTLVVIGTILSFCIFGKLLGVREGTVAAALSVGIIVRFIGRNISMLKRFNLTKN